MNSRLRSLDDYYGRGIHASEKLIEIGKISPNPLISGWRGMFETSTIPRSWWQRLDSTSCWVSPSGKLRLGWTGSRRGSLFDLRWNGLAARPGTLVIPGYPMRSLSAFTIDTTPREKRGSPDASDRSPDRANRHDGAVRRRSLVRRPGRLLRPPGSGPRSRPGLVLWRSRRLCAGQLRLVRRRSAAVLPGRAGRPGGPRLRGPRLCGAAAAARPGCRAL